MTVLAQQAFSAKGVGHMDNFAYDWSAPLSLGNGDGIVSATITATPFGLAISDSVVRGTEVSAWISGGVVGTTYRVLCTIKTGTGRVLDWPATLLVTA